MELGGIEGVAKALATDMALPIVLVFPTFSHVRGRVPSFPHGQGGRSLRVQETKAKISVAKYKEAAVRQIGPS